MGVHTIRNNENEIQIYQVHRAPKVNGRLGPTILWLVSETRTGKRQTPRERFTVNARTSFTMVAFLLVPCLSFLISSDWPPPRLSPLKQQYRCLQPRCSLTTDDPRVLTVDVDRVTGIDFGCDLQLRWPYVMGLVPNGAAARTGLIKLGDQLVAVGGESILGLGIGEAMERLGTAEGGTEVALTFFRGSREQLKSIVGADASGAPESVTITLQRPGLPDDQIRVPYGANLRDELVARKINVYQSITRWTNCNGQQLCGTCIVNVAQGLEACTRRSLDESSTLRENPETYKLACITNVYGDITVQLMPKVGAAQWTR